MFDYIHLFVSFLQMFSEEFNMFIRILYFYLLLMQLMNENLFRKKSVEMTLTIIVNYCRLMSVELVCKIHILFNLFVTLAIGD
jgi:hypothetical protein